MKNLLHSLLPLVCLLLPLTGFAQHPDEALIRVLEEKERIAILEGDTTQLAVLMSKNIVVHNPENSIIGFQQIISRIRQGKINYAFLDRKIENIAFVNGIAVVMGLETILAQGETKNAGKTVQRRFTNVWAKENDIWKLSARQATIISIN